MLCDTCYRSGGNYILDDAALIDKKELIAGSMGSQ